MEGSLISWGVLDVFRALDSSWLSSASFFKGAPKVSWSKAYLFRVVIKGKTSRETVFGVAYSNC